MKNDLLNVSILKILNRVDTGLRKKTLQNEVEIAVDRPTLTTDELDDAIIYLKDRSLIETYVNMLGDEVIMITEDGKAALKGW